MRRAALFFFIIALLLFNAGCGSQSSGTKPPPPPPAEVPVSLTVTDTPTTGVTVLFDQLSITGATMSSASGGSVSLLSSSNPVPVNIAQLQTESAFLGSANVAAGTYDSLSLTFSNPQITIFNGSGAVIGVGASTCAINMVCQLTPTTTPLTLTFSTVPFPVTLTASSPLVLELDIHLNTVIQPDLSVNLAATNGVTISQVAQPKSGKTVSALASMTGTIQAINTNGFSLQTGDGRNLSILVGSSTVFNFPSSVCSAANLSCLGLGEIFQVDASLQTDGTLLASEVNYLEAAQQTVVQGSIIRLSASAGNTLMDLILQKGAPTTNPLSFGERVTVTVPPSGVTYAVDSGGFALPEGLSFGSASDLLVGQQVQVNVLEIAVAGGSSTSTPFTSNAATTFITSSITLEPSPITGSITAIQAPALSFTLTTYPNYFIPPAATPNTAPTALPVNITVQTTSGTTFTNFTHDIFSGLAVKNVVSVEGWLFHSPGASPGACTVTTGCPPNTTIAAETVLARPGTTPLF